MASMGPHSSECGNLIGAVAHGPVSEELQWGRTHLSAETLRLIAADRIRWALQWGRTHLSAETGRRASATAWAPKLQWGRTHLSAETAPLVVNCVAAVGPLQWGRTHLSAETRRKLGRARLALFPASMGPHSSECGNPTNGGGLSHGLLASMGPHSSECGNMATRCGAGYPSRGFNGAALI